MEIKMDITFGYWCFGTLLIAFIDFLCYVNIVVTFIVILYLHMLYQLSSGIYVLACLAFLILLMMYDFKLFLCGPAKK